MEQLKLQFRKNLKVGDKVKIVGKSTGIPSRRSTVCNKLGSDGVGYITIIHSNRTYVVDAYKSTTGDFFLEKDLEGV